MLNHFKALTKPPKFYSGSRKKTELVVEYVRMVFYMWEMVLFYFLLGNTMTLFSSVEKRTDRYIC